MTNTTPAPGRKAFDPLDSKVVATQAREEEVELGQILTDFFKSVRSERDEQFRAAEKARPALKRLTSVMRTRTNQSAHVRALLYSLWNGQPTSLLEVVSLDWKVRKDLCRVIEAFGFEEKDNPAASFFYDAVKTVVAASGQWDWFIAAHEEKAE